MVLTHIALHHFCSSHFCLVRAWKQSGLQLGTSDNCPLMSLTPSEKKLYQLYMSATPMFSWNAKLHVEWNVRTLKLINLHLCMTGQTYFIVTHCMNWILFFLHLYWPLTV